MTVEILLGTLTLLGGLAAYVISLSVRVGGLLQRLSSLEARHAENTKEHREKIAALDGRANNTEKWMAGVDAKLDGVTATLAEVKAMLIDKRGKR